MRITLRSRNEFENSAKYMQYLLDMKGITTPLCHNDWRGYAYEEICREFDNLRGKAADALNKLEEDLKTQLSANQNREDLD